MPSQSRVLVGKCDSLPRLLQGTVVGGTAKHWRQQPLTYTGEGDFVPLGGRYRRASVPCFFGETLPRFTETGFLEMCVAKVAL